MCSNIKIENNQQLWDDDKWERAKEDIISTSNYDQLGFLEDMSYLAGQIKFFHNNVATKQTGNPSTSFYKPKHCPEEHQVAYFNLTRGFPKELRGGHWCYILKHFKSKVLVVPCTSVKYNSSEPDPDYQLDIELDNFPNGRRARLQFSDARVIDIQRIYQAKGFYDVLTPRALIVNTFSDIIY